MSPAQEANYELQSVTRTASDHKLGKVDVFISPRLGRKSPAQLSIQAVGAAKAFNDCVFRSHLYPKIRFPIPLGLSRTTPLSAPAFARRQGLSALHGPYATACPCAHFRRFAFPSE